MFKFIATFELMLYNKQSPIMGGGHSQNMGPKLDFHLVLVPLFQKWPHARALP
jgi:hypothetical protein